MQVKKLDELKVANPYLRLESDVSDLEKSIRTIGLISPLVISPDNTILAGGRRYRALLNLGYTEAPVLVVDQGELESELISIDENLVRKDLNKIEIEQHLRRAKEIYQDLYPEEQFTSSQSEADKSELADEQQEDQQGRPEVIKQKSVQKLPGEKFLQKISEKTGLSPRQIHQAIDRDEKASEQVKEARKKGELSISQTNELVKLNKEDQQKSLNHLKTRPVREIRQFIKMAKTKGVDEAIRETPQGPHAREFREIEATLKKLQKQLKKLEVEGISLDDLPESTHKVLGQIYEQSSLKLLPNREVKEAESSAYQ